jgi:endonuclease/exonuclease/phosphatase family metal-dependent hydrolase
MKKALFLLLGVILLSCKSNKLDEGDPGILHIGTFNIQWLGDGIDDKKKRDSVDYANTAGVIREMNADIICLQEVENDSAMNLLMPHLPGYKFILGKSGWLLNQGIIYRENIEIESHGDYFPLAVVENRTRPGFWFRAKKNNFDFYGMVVHFKSTSRWDSTDEMRRRSFEIRSEQSEMLDNWADSVLALGGEEDIILIGDFNDNPTRKKSRNLAALLEDNQFDFITKDMKSCANPLWDNIDHIAITKSISERIIPGTMRMIDQKSMLSDEAAEMVSDHCPVVVGINCEMPDNDGEGI